MVRLVMNSMELKKHEVLESVCATSEGLTISTFRLSTISDLINHHKLLFLFVGVFLGVLISFLFYPRTYPPVDVVNVEASTTPYEVIPVPLTQGEDLLHEIPGLGFYSPPALTDYLEVHGLHQQGEEPLLVCESVIRESRIRTPGLLDLVSGKFEPAANAPDYSGLIIGATPDFYKVLVARKRRKVVWDLNTNSVRPGPFQWDRFVPKMMNNELTRGVGTIRSEENPQLMKAIGLWTPEKQVQRIDLPGFHFRSLTIVDVDRDCRSALVSLIPSSENERKLEYLLMNFTDDVFQMAVTQNLGESPTDYLIATLKAN